MPVPGGTTRKFLKAWDPHFKKLYLSAFLENSSSTFLLKESAFPAKSTITEWSITKSTGDNGFILVGSLFNLTIASRIAAKSTTAGTPVKSCINTLAGLKAISIPLVLPLVD